MMIARRRILHGIKAGVMVRVMAAALLALPPVFAAIGAGHAAAGVTFHFYGADNCPPCQAFKRNHLADVRSRGEKHGFAVAANFIPRLQDIPNPGVYGASDAILREAVGKGAATYPPIFFVSANDAVISVHGQKWQDALDAAIKAAAASR